jgi:hypothetical protein
VWPSAGPSASRSVNNIADADALANLEWALVGTVVVHGKAIRCVLDDDDMATTGALVSVIRNLVDNTIARRKNVKGPAVVDATVHLAGLPANGVAARAIRARYGATRSRVLEAVKHTLFYQSKWAYLA